MNWRQLMFTKSGWQVTVVHSAIAMGVFVFGFFMVQQWFGFDVTVYVPHFEDIPAQYAKKGK